MSLVLSSLTQKLGLRRRDRIEFDGGEKKKKEGEERMKLAVASGET